MRRKIGPASWGPIEATGPANMNHTSAGEPVGHMMPIINKRPGEWLSTRDASLFLRKDTRRNHAKKVTNEPG